MPDAWLVWFLKFNTHPSQFKQYSQFGERLLHRNFEPQDLPKGPFRLKKRGPFRFLGDAGAPMLAAHPAFQGSDFAGDREDSKSTSGGILCIFGSHTFVPISGMCKKQTSVSHSSTESEVIFSWCRSTHGWNCRSWSLGFGYRSVAFFFQPTWEIQRECAGKPAAWHTIKKTHQDSNSVQRSWIMQRRLCFSKREVFSIWCDALHFWRQWSSDQDDHQG